MSLSKKISPSLMCADFLHLGDELKTLEECGIEYLHIDIMDGVFVQNYTLGTDFVRMITEPHLKLDWFDLRPGDYVGFHVEAEPHVQRTLAAIRDRGAKPMLVLNPGTPLNVLDEVLPDLDAVLLMTVNPGFAGQKLIPQTLDKIARLRRMLDERGYENVEIEVDGNVSFENAAKMSRAGANIFVAGTSSIYAKNGSVKENAEKLRSVL